METSHSLRNVRGCPHFTAKETEAPRAYVLARDPTAAPTATSASVRGCGSPRPSPSGESPWCLAPWQTGPVTAPPCPSGGRWNLSLRFPPRQEPEARGSRDGWLGGAPPPRSCTHTSHRITRKLTIAPALGLTSAWGVLVLHFIPGPHPAWPTTPGHRCPGRARAQGAEGGSADR